MAEDRYTIDLRYVLGIFFRRKVVIILTTLLVTGLAAVGALMLPKMYESSTKLFLDRVDPKNPLDGAMPGEKFTAKLETLTELVRSDPILTECINRIGADRMLAALDAKDMAGAIQELRGRVAATADSSFSFTISASMEDAELAKQVAETLAQLFMEASLKSDKAPTTSTARVLKQQVDEYKEKTDRLREEIRQFKERHRDTLPEMYNLYTGQRQSYQSMLMAAELDLKRALGEKITYQRLLETDPSLKIDVDSAAARELEAAKLELDRLQVTHRDNHPDVIRVRARIRALEETLQKRAVESQTNSLIKSQGYRAAESRVRDLSLQVEALQRAIAEYRAQIDRLTGLLATIPETEKQLAQLENQYKLSQSFYDRAAGQYAELNLSEKLIEDSQQNRFSVLRPAIVPGSPKPSTKLIVAAGAAAGLILGIVLAILFEFMDPMVNHPRDLELRFGKPVLATIPGIESRTAGGLAGRVRGWESKEAREQGSRGAWENEGMGEWETQGRADAFADAETETPYVGTLERPTSVTSDAGRGDVGYRTDVGRGTDGRRTYIERRTSNVNPQSAIKKGRGWQTNEEQQVFPGYWEVGANG